MMDKKASLVWIEDHRTVAEMLALALCDRLPISFVAHFDRIQQAMTACPEIKPDLVIIDWRLQDGAGAGLALPQQLSQLLPKTRWLLFTGYPDPFVVRAAIEAGVHGCVSKGVSPNVLIQACSALLAGETYFCTESTRSLHRIMEGKTAELNPTELKILRCVAGGMEPKEISMSAGLAVGTVRNYLVQIRHKLGIESLVDLANFAITHGIAPPY